jgi:hypothetical protein
MKMVKNNCFLAFLEFLSNFRQKSILLIFFILKRFSITNNRSTMGQNMSKLSCSPTVTDRTEDETALYWAARYRNLAVVKRLLENGTDPNKAKMDNGETALLWAARIKNVQMVRLLLTYGADPNIARSDTGETPLYRAVCNNKMEMVELLLSKGADPNMARSDTGGTPIYQAVCHNNMEMVKVLVLYGSNVVARIYANNVAKQKGHGDIVHFFEKIKGLTTFQIAVYLPDLLPREIKNLLRRGVLDPDKCGGSLAAVHALAASNTSKPEEMKRIVRWAFEGWTPYSNWLYSQSFQENVKTTLLIAQQLEVASEKEESTVVCLPLELWLLVLNFVNRKDWKK